MTDYTPLNPIYKGPAALAAYNQAFNINVAGIPIEDGAQPGSSGSHLEEGPDGFGDSVRVIDGFVHPVLDNELMSPRFDAGVVNPMSAITLGMLEDLGWTVDYSHAQNFPT